MIGSLRARRLSLSCVAGCRVRRPLGATPALDAGSRETRVVLLLFLILILTLADLIPLKTRTFENNRS